jgi:enediyne biosynthesis protein E2
MPAVLGSMRRLIFSPSLSDVSFAHLGFPAAPTEASQRLEAVPQSVICGFEWGIEIGDQRDLECRLDLVDSEMRGFAYEGATMALTIRDTMGPGRGHRTRDLLDGPGRRHLFLAYIGIGFAMARLPRVLWKKVVPDLAESDYHPVMSWLAVDGFGFDRAYFDHQQWVGGQRRPAAYPWQGWPDYFARAFDQGVGRALWFIHGGQVPDVAATVRGFDAGRQADLWSGVGLAAAFAGGCPADGYTALCREAGAHRPDLVQGAVFAAKARDYSGCRPVHTQTALATMADLSVEGAAELADSVVIGSSDDVPPYEMWRRAIRARVDSAATRI